MIVGMVSILLGAVSHAYTILFLKFLDEDCEDAPS